MYIYTYIYMYIDMYILHSPPVPVGRQDCRCFVSSLREITTLSLDTSFPQRGRCYLSNCYRVDYLQVRA
jgi:hypothetical protein